MTKFPLTRETVAILFADARGYSRLDEYALSAFLTELLPEISVVADETDPFDRNSWGDGIVLFFRSAINAARCSLALRDLFEQRDWQNSPFRQPLAIRVAINWDEVFVGDDPLRSRTSVVGAAVNLAARIEPVVPPNHVYITSGFRDALDYATRTNPDAPFAVDDVGTTELAKGWGPERVHNLRWKRDAPFEVTLVEASIVQVEGDSGGVIETSGEAVLPLVVALDEGSPSVKRTVIQILRTSGDARAIQGLISVADNAVRHTSELRAEAIHGLAAMDDAAAVPALIKALQDPDQKVKFAAISALANIGDVRALEPLVSVLGDRAGTGGELRGAAATALHMLKDARAVPALIEALDDPDVQVKGTAITSLGELADTRALEPLVAVLKDREGTGGELRGTAATSLHMLKDARAVPALIEALDDPDVQVKGTAITSLGELADARALEPLVAVLKDREGTGGELRGAAATALHMLKDARAVPALIEALEDPDRNVKGTAISSLGQLADVRALEPLIAVLKDLEGTGGELRGTAATSLHMLKDARAVPALIEALGDTDRQVKGTAITSLGRLADPRALEPLVAVLKDREGTSGDVRGAAATALHLLKDARAVPALIEALDDPDPKVFGPAATSLGVLSDPRAAPRLVSLLVDDTRQPSAQLCGTVLMSLLRIGTGVDDAALHMLENRLGDERVLIFALRVLRAHDSEVGRNKLLEIASSESSLTLHAQHAMNQDPVKVRRAILREDD